MTSPQFLYLEMAIFNFLTNSLYSFLCIKVAGVCSAFTLSSTLYRMFDLVFTAPKDFILTKIKSYSNRCSLTNNCILNYTLEKFQTLDNRGKARISLDSHLNLHVL